ncbi:MAG: class I SAM-dependent methyltransferase [Asgard group archaeon]|nr:class I SAM-dependent methyltransferase [Asgard group archaeon]
MTHYYSQRPSSSGKTTTIRTFQLGNSLIFKSQSGVFSWREVDTGSEVLINNVNLPKKGMILDLGCGYGFIGIALAKAFPNLQFILVDINKLAIRLTKENCKHNEVQSNTKVYQGDLFQPLKDKFFDVIITNPPLMAGKEVLKKIVKQSKEHLHKKGSLQLVVPKKKGLKSMQKMLEEEFTTFEELARSSGYWVLRAEK